MYHRCLERNTKVEKLEVIVGAMPDLENLSQLRELME